ncbi:Rhodanese-like domain-containing protein [Cynara cardunculus var. scolymus]|uniref:Rhodanese-like domain-containing protein n=1 Tax=Cynara cardunculus var. scolymus TaxID=59895 RepID=A0A103XNP1_CYNCS|nr:Rhodanese-like domain-containing protein [Cynara cardunculus var. scolymus]
MESLSIPLSSSPPFSKNPKTHKITTPKPYFLFPNCNLIPNSIQSLSNFIKKTPKSSITTTLKPNLQSLSFLFVGFPFPLSSFASESASIELPTNQSSSKINLEAIVVSIDDFFNRYPFFVAGVVFIWLFVIPVSQGYLRKYKPISAIDAFKKLKEDPNAQLLDIRDNKTVRVLGSPNLKILNKKAVQVEFSDGDDEGSFDGDSMKVAELLFNNGFKEAYAIRGGEIQETLLPPSVHVFPKTGVKKSNNNGSVGKQSEAKSEPTFLDSKQTNNGYVDTSTKPNTSVRPSSPYSMYPDMKPPSSPTPSKPQ